MISLRGQRGGMRSGSDLRTHAEGTTTFEEHQKSYQIPLRGGDALEPRLQSKTYISYFLCCTSPPGENLLDPPQSEMGTTMIMMFFLMISCIMSVERVITLLLWNEYQGIQWIW